MAYNSYTNTSSVGGCPTPPPCPACGGLECLCRPRFYAGQQLTADDLNRLENYVVAKNKLHNRYLNGWGVVCGLEIVCSPCGDTVRVKPGYALSPCGEDIIVCNGTTVPVGSLIKACRPANTPDCLSPWQTTQDNCKEATDKWILAICYDEKQTRGSQSYGGVSGSGSHCACSGASSCGCGCQSSTNKTATNHRSASSIQAPQCEPTLICEGYTFRVYKDPAYKQDTAFDPGPLIEKITACQKEHERQTKAIPAQTESPPVRYQWCCTFKQYLYDLLVTEGVYDCTLADQLAIIQCPNPDPNNGDFDGQWKIALAQLMKVYDGFYSHCLCSALLPSCPEPVTTDCVPLAAITVRRSDYKVLNVCNWGVRKFAVTLPNLGYWLSPILAPLAFILNNRIENQCCEPLDLKEYIAKLYRPPNANIQGAQLAQANTPENAQVSIIAAGRNETKPPEGEIAGLFHQIFSIFSPEKSTPDGAASVPAKNTATVPATNTTVSTNTPIPPEKEFTTLLYQALMDPDRGFDAKALVLFNALGAKDADGRPLLSDLESRNPAQFVLLNQVIAPLIRDVIPEPSKTIAGKASTNAFVTDAATAQAAQIARLSSIVDELAAQVAQLSSKLPK